MNKTFSVIPRAKMFQVTLIVLFGMILCVCGAPLVSKADVDAINNRPNAKWRADLEQGHLVSGATKHQIQSLLGVKKTTKLPRRQFTDSEKSVSLPQSFDAATKWPHCQTITHIRDQSACGSCWAVAAAESISDRFCTYGGPSNLLISAANLLECCSYCGQGCGGGDPALAWLYWSTSGLVSDTCQPYPFPKCEHHIPKNHYPPCPQNAYPTPSCPSPATSCSNSNATSTLHYGNKSWSLMGEDDFKRELFSTGPLEVTFSVYKDFLSYKSGVYESDLQNYLGGHAVKLVGWGTLNGTPYWKIANSWNTDWGLNGYFLIERGVDMCGIEDSGTAGSPKLG